MDKNELKAMIVSIILMVVFITVLFVARANNSLDVPQCIDGVDPSTFKAGLVDKGDKKYDLFILAQMWNFVTDPSGDPNTPVNLPEGCEVDIYVMSKDVMHSLSLYEKGLSMMAAYGALNKVTVKFDKKGVYKLVCAEYCGSAHQSMAKDIVVN